MKYLRVEAVGKPEKISLLVDKKYLKSYMGSDFVKKRQLKLRVK